jgi:hypothetical protein
MDLTGQLFFCNMTPKDLICQAMGRLPVDFKVYVFRPPPEDRRSV